MPYFINFHNPTKPERENWICNIFAILFFAGKERNVTKWAGKSATALSVDNI